MKKTPLLFSVATAAMLLAASSAQAVRLNMGVPAAVNPTDNTFTFDIIGYGSGGAGDFYVVTPGTVTFGTTYTGVDYDTNPITLTTAESVDPLAGTTTDTFTISTSTNFLNETTVNGTIINTLQFDIGDSTSGGGTFPPAKPVSVFPDIATYTATGAQGNVSDPSANTLHPTTNIASDGSSYNAAEGVNSGSPMIGVSTDGVNSFTYSITYNSLVPEPSTWALLGLGAVGVAVTVRRRRVTV
jgi:hypothetical protein